MGAPWRWGVITCFVILAVLSSVSTGFADGFVPKPNQILLSDESLFALCLFQHLLFPSIFSFRCCIYSKLVCLWFLFWMFELTLWIFPATKPHDFLILKKGPDVHVSSGQACLFLYTSTHEHILLTLMRRESQFLQYPTGWWVVVLKVVVCQNVALAFCCSISIFSIMSFNLGSKNSWIDIFYIQYICRLDQYIMWLVKFPWKTKYINPDFMIVVSL